MNDCDFSTIGNATNERIKKGILPGAIITICIGGEKVYEFIDGYSNIEKKQPLTKNSLFRLASMTKPITAAACLIMQDRGLISVKDKVSKYLPKFKNMFIGEIDGHGILQKRYKAENEITIKDILTHSSGLGSGVIGDMQYNAYGHKDGKNLAETVDGYANILLDFSPGSSQMYSASQALDIVARIIELTSGLEYEEFLKKNLFAPLCMHNTAYRLTKEQWKRVVPMYRLSNDANNINELIDLGRRGFQGFSEGYPGGAAGLISCSDDYVNFANMLTCNGVWKGKRILSEQAVLDMRSPHFENGFAGMNPFFHWGYGVRVVEQEKDDVQMLSAGSYGWSGAYNTHFWVDPKLNLSGVYMCNMDNAGGAGAITAFEFECNTMKAIAKSNIKQ